MIPANIPPELAAALAQRGHEIEAAERSASAKPLINFTDPDTGAPIGTLLLRDGAVSFEGNADAAAMLLIREVVSQHDAALQALAQAIRGTHKGAADGLKLVGTTATTRDGLRRGAALLGLEPPAFDGRE